MIVIGLGGSGVMTSRPPVTRPSASVSASSEARAALLKVLRLPEHMSTNALLQALNLRFARAEFLARFETTEEES